MKVVFLIVDGLPHRHVNERTTPHLMRLASGGARSLRGGLATMSAATYPNHRTFVTGTDAASHGVVVNDFRSHHPGDVTLLGLLQAHGVDTAAVWGDQHLVQVTASHEAGWHWPPNGVLPDGTAVDELGYPTDDAVLTQLLPAVDQLPDVLVAHLNDPDTAGHLLGPDTPEAHERYRATDAAFGKVMEALFSHWRDLVFIVVSDHDQEPITQAEPIDLTAQLAKAGVEGTVRHEGSAALVTGGDETARWLTSRRDLAGEAVPGGWLVWGEPGTWFAPHSFAGSLRGTHGSPRSRSQVVVVSGGHACAVRLAAAVSARQPRAADWAPTIAALVGIAMPTATGAALVPLLPPAPPVS